MKCRNGILFFHAFFCTLYFIHCVINIYAESLIYYIWSRANIYIFNQYLHHSMKSCNLCNILFKGISHFAELKFSLGSEDSTFSPIINFVYSTIKLCLKEIFLSVYYLIMEKKKNTEERGEYIYSYKRWCIG